MDEMTTDFKPNPEPIAALLSQRIDTAYGGSQKAFSDATGLPVSYVNQIVRRRVAVPGKAQRLILARELGLREVDMYVMAGEVPESDVTSPAARMNADERELVDMFRAMPQSARTPLLTTVRELLKAVR